MRWPWTRTKPPKETDVMNRTSVEWAEEITRLTAEQAATAEEAASLTEQLGSAILDAPASVATLQHALATAQARQTGLAAAIGQARSRQAAAAQEEARLRLSLDARAWLATAARWVTRLAEAQAIQEQLAAVLALQAPAVAADRETLDRIRSRVASLSLPPIETLTSGSSAQLRQRAATLSEQAERATVRDGRVTFTGETIDAASIPPVAAKVDRPPVPISELARQAELGAA
jgi:hypothetical protein